MTKLVRRIQHTCLAVIVAMPLMHATANAEVLEGIEEIPQSLSLESNRLVGRGIFEYTFRMEISNEGAAATDVVGLISSSNQYIVVVDDTVEFGDVGKFGTVYPEDTFSVRINKRFVTFDQAYLSYEFSGELEATLGSVSGNVTLLPQGIPAGGAMVSIEFPETDAGVTNVVANENGSYEIGDLPFDGSYLINAISSDGTATGSVEGFLIESDPVITQDIEISPAGGGSLTATVNLVLGTPVSDAIVTAFFPESERTYSGSTDSGGQVTLSGLVLDGTVIVTAVVPESGLSASVFTIINPAMPNGTASLILDPNVVVNAVFTNAAFTVGSHNLNGWQTKGTVGTVSSSDVFDLSEEQP